ncbi:MAG: ribosome-binding factor A [Saprospiraceae bacterium]|nr:ribosome-binding factor A [Saprospiraceae bacterium]
MESIRQKQVGELIKRNFSFILQQGRWLYLRKRALVTIMNVKMTPDLSEARFISVFTILNISKKSFCAWKKPIQNCAKA